MYGSHGNYLTWFKSEGQICDPRKQDFFFLQKWLTATQKILLKILVKILNTQLKATWE